MRRFAAIILLIAALTPLLWLRTPVTAYDGPARLRYHAIDPGRLAAAQLGPFQLEKAWRIQASQLRYGGFSGLAALGDGRLLAVSDGGTALEFSVPDAAVRNPPSGTMLMPEFAAKYSRDIEAATRDPATGRIWIALEFSNMIMRLDYRDGRLRHATGVRPPAMRDWGNNSGPESLVRLRDGRFISIREGRIGMFEGRRHAAALFATDPVRKPDDVTRFRFVGPDGFNPTDAALLPDGRVLVLLRRVDWPMPPRFAGAIAIGDPAAIREGREWRVRTLATWKGGYPIDNLEGMAIEPSGAEDGSLTVWLISDDNRAALQNTVLWKLRLDPSDLPPAQQKGAR